MRYPPLDVRYPAILQTRPNPFMIEPRSRIIETAVTPSNSAFRGNPDGTVYNIGQITNGEILEKRVEFEGCQDKCACSPVGCMPIQHHTEGLMMSGTSEAMTVAPTHGNKATFGSCVTGQDKCIAEEVRTTFRPRYPPLTSAERRKILREVVPLHHIQLQYFDFAL